MTSPEPDFDALIDALRSDLPNDGDERRVRARLLAAGVAVAGVFVPNAAAGATGIAAGSSTSVTLLHKLGALSWMTKVGLAGVVATTAAAPVAVHWARQEPQRRTLEVARTVPRVAARIAPRAHLPQESAAELAAHPNPVEPATDPVTPQVGVERRQSLLEPGLVSAPPRAFTPDTAKAPSDGAAVAAFPVDEARPRTAGTLREETELVERALYALRLGDREGARRLLEEHGRRFPSGLLARERDRALARASARTPAP